MKKDQEPTVNLAEAPAAGASGAALDALPWFGPAGATGMTQDQLVAATQPPTMLPGFAGSHAPTQPPPFAPPEAAVAERMRDDGEIARGGMGSIRKVFDTELRRHVARKVIDSGLAENPFAAQKFLDEARITGMLEHPNMVPVHDLVRGGAGEASYTMKLVSGQTLTALIEKQRTRRDLEHILQCMIKVCEALAYAHNRGVIHRDLKPDNIMVGEYGQVYVMDWGCALVTGDRSELGGTVEADGTILGTVQYMAPEQALGKISQIDARSDVFSLGAILYKVLTGSAPYVGPLAAALPAAQLCEFVPPGDASGTVKPPPHLTEIVMKAMARDKPERFQTADEFAEALRQFLRGGNWFPMRKFAKGEVIVKEGDPPDAAYIITAGRCEVRKRDASKPTRHQVLRVLKAGDVFGETAIFAHAPRSATVVALDEVSAVVVERTELEGIVANSWLGQFVKALADRFLDLDARLAAAKK